MGKSQKPKPEPRSSSPAKSSPELAESQEPQSPPEDPTSESSPPPEEDFESYYLKQVTAEFADDIDKLRKAPDFSAQSVPVLIQALKQGSKGFSDEEKEKVMRER